MTEAELIRILLYMLGGTWLIGLLGLLAYFGYKNWLFPIQVLVLKYQGDDRRPKAVVTRARRRERDGVMSLKILGYKYLQRDFERQNYYPGEKGRDFIIAWEFKPGLITAVVPNKTDLPEKVVKEMAGAWSVLGKYRGVEFEYDPELYRQLVLKAVDDTNMHWIFQQKLANQRRYDTGFWGFMNKYGGHLLTALVLILVFAGFVVWLDKVPELANKCLSVARNTMEDAGFFERAVNQINPGA